jgi:hypothetical protein
MQVRVNFKKPGSGVCSIFLNWGEKLKFYRGKAHRVPKDPENVFNVAPIKWITSIEILDEKETKNEGRN